MKSHTLMREHFEVSLEDPTSIPEREIEGLVVHLGANN
jgi:hypothetical protein